MVRANSRSEQWLSALRDVILSDGSGDFSNRSQAPAGARTGMLSQTTMRSSCRAPLLREISMDIATMSRWRRCVAQREPCESSPPARISLLDCTFHALSIARDYYVSDPPPWAPNRHLLSKGVIPMYIKWKAITWYTFCFSNFKYYRFRFQQSRMHCYKYCKIIF